jgi:hypothetical protein
MKKSSHFENSVLEQDVQFEALAPQCSVPAPRAYLPSYAEAILEVRRAVQHYRATAQTFADPAENWH